MKHIINGTLSTEQLEYLKKQYLYIAAPVYSAPDILFVQSMNNLQYYLSDLGIPHAIELLGGESLVSRARNTIAHHFLQSDATHLMFIDSDIGFRPESIFELVLCQKQLIGGIYPKKFIDWGRVKQAVLNGVAPEHLEKCATQHVWGDETKRSFSIVPNEPFEANYVPTGFMLIERKVFEDYRAAFPDEWYWQPQARHEKAWEFFPTSINKKTRVLESEDYGFSRRVSELGVKTYLAPWINLVHVGKYSYEGEFFASRGIYIRDIKEKK